MDRSEGSAWTSLFSGGMAMSEAGAGFFGLVGRGLRNVARFSGRDAPAQFWPYAGTVFLLSVVVWFIAMALSMEGIPDFVGLAVAMAVIAGTVVILLAAAVTRRLHDRGRSGYWGLPVVIFLTIGLVGTIRIFSEFSAGAAPDTGVVGLLALNNLIYLASLAVLLFRLVQRGSRGPNRFGEDPIQP